MRRTTPAMLPLALVLTAQAVLSSPSPDRLAKFSALAKKGNGIVVLNSQTFDELTEAPRNFSVSVLLTAMGNQFKCAPCQTFAPEHALVAKSWAGHSEKNDHFMAVLDFEDGQAIYQRLRLSSAPTFYLFKPTEGPRASAKVEPESFDFSRAGFKAEAVASYLRGNANIPLKFTRPVDKLKAASLVGSMVVFAIAVFAAWPVLKIALQQKYIWAFVTISTILIMTSGFMWNQIRHPQYMQVGQNGRVTYIQGGYSNQLGAETPIISAIYGLLAFSTYTLAYTIPKLNEPIRQRVGIYVWTGISVVMLGVLMNVFSIKQGGYPFRLF